MEEEKKANEVLNDEVVMEDEEVAELAARKLKESDKEIARLKKELAKQKLLYTAEDDEEETLTREDCIKTFNDKTCCDYDRFVAANALRDIETKAGHPDPYGADGQQVYDFIADVLDECGGDKSRFYSIYQSKVMRDSPEVAMAYKKYLEKNNIKRS